MAFLSKSQILAADDQRFDSVSCPEWDGDVRVRGLTAYEQSYIAKLVGDEKKERSDAEGRAIRMRRRRRREAVLR